MYPEFWATYYHIDRLRREAAKAAAGERADADPAQDTVPAFAVPSIRRLFHDLVHGNWRSPVPVLHSAVGSARNRTHDRCGANKR